MKHIRIMLFFLIVAVLVIFNVWYRDTGRTVVITKNRTGVVTIGPMHVGQSVTLSNGTIMTFSAVSGTAGKRIATVDYLVRGHEEQYLLAEQSRASGHAVITPGGTLAYLRTTSMMWRTAIMLTLTPRG